MLPLLLVLAQPPQEPKPVTYPESRRGDVVDDYHGTPVPDPYRWLEDDVRNSSDVARWVAAQNAVTEAYLKAIPQREAIGRRLKQLANYERYGVPSKTAGRYFFSKNDGLQNQSVLYVADGPDADPRVLLDPNGWSKDGTVALGAFVPDDDARRAAYLRSEAGSDWQTVRVLDVATGQELPDELKWVKFSGVSWTPDGKGFFYSRFPEPQPGQSFQSLNVNQKLYYHRVGSPQAADVLVYERPDQPKWGVSGTVTEDGRFLVVSVSDGTTSRKARIAYKDLTEPYGLVTDLVANHTSKLDFVGNDGPVFYFRTEWKAARGQVIAIDTRKPAEADWKTVVPESRDTLQSVSLVGNLFACSYLRDAQTAVKLYAVDGTFVRDVDLPGIGTAAGFGGRRTDTETFYAFSSFATPPTVYRYDLLIGRSKLLRQSKVQFDPAGYEVSQVFYQSKDGTKVPLFLTHKKGLTRDGTNPTLLYGYGGFNIPQTPGFSVLRAQWLEMGGVLAVACLRGGGEYGEEWHRAGTKLNKQNVFDDFIAAAEYLVAQKVTSPKKLAIQGGSNGGLLVGAVMVQRPDLFGACLPAVGVMDMLRFQRFTAGRFWVDDYGSSDNKAEFEALRKYSPYHNLKPGVKYPPTLVTTADTDDRVVPGHSFKFTAQLQHCQAGDAPVLARIETKAGHGAGKPLAKQLEETADLWAFLVKALDFTPVLPE
jgi:prolyl oligopeptidase